MGLILLCNMRSVETAFDLKTDILLTRKTVIIYVYMRLRLSLVRLLLIWIAGISSLTYAVELRISTECPATQWQNLGTFPV